MNALRAGGAAFLATWRAMLGDTGALMLLFAGGLVYSFFYPLPYARESVQRVPVAVVDQDHSALSRQLTRFAQAHPSVNVVAVTPDLREAQDLLWRNQIAGTLFIPAGLQGKVLSGRQAEVEIAGNGVYMMLNKAVLNGLAEAVGTVSAGIEVKRLSAASPSPAQALAQRQPLGFNAVALFNVREGYGAYVVPGVAVLIVQQTLLLAITLMFGSWVERGGFPVRRDLPGYFGMLFAFASVAVINSAYYFGFVMWWQDYPRGGNPLGLALFVPLFGLAVAAFGMLLGSWFRTRERSAQLLLCAAMPLMFLSGLSWPLEALPEPLLALRWLVPSTPGIQGFIALNQLGARLPEVAAEAAGLGALLLACVGLGLWRWKKAG
ncbi:ABC transporter permease [Eleftheria terrae]|uniref:ABC transporter permease n=1 Tax=Eleftheria terrae TaxID=1597781 RepID=UPI00263B647B|nr:ABC transporter permease [Eleftheria terrae]WKB52700.1 ABC transporter permease [Eleftheria terrae]